MKRRDFLKTAGAVGAALTLPGSAWSAGPEIVKPLPKQVRWQDFELGLVYHFDLDVYMPTGARIRRM